MIKLKIKLIIQRSILQDFSIKNQLHSRQKPCRSPRLTVIGIGLRELFYQKVRLPSV